MLLLLALEAEANAVLGGPRTISSVTVMASYQLDFTRPLSEPYAPFVDLALASNKGLRLVVPSFKKPSSLVPLLADLRWF